MRLRWNDFKRLMWKVKMLLFEIIKSAKKREPPGRVSVNGEGRSSPCSWDSKFIYQVVIAQHLLWFYALAQHEGCGNKPRWAGSLPWWILARIPKQFLRAHPARDIPLLSQRNQYVNFPPQHTITPPRRHYSRTSHYYQVSFCTKKH